MPELSSNRAAGLGLLTVALLLVGVTFGLDGKAEFVPGPVLATWAGSLIALTGAAWFLSGRPRLELRHGWEPLKPDLPWLIVILAVALVARLTDIGGIPQNLGGDEAGMGLDARKVLAGSLREPFATGYLSHPNLWFFAQARALQLFGDSVAGLRTLSALLGVLTVPALYLFARPHFGRGVALAAAALLAAFHFHVHFSRLAMNNVADPLLLLLGFAAVLHGWRTRSLLSFTAAGILLGLSQHLYFGSRLALPIIGALVVHQLIFDRRHLVTLWRGFLFAGLGFVATVGPLLWFWATHLPDFNARLAQVGVLQSGWLERELAAGRGLVDVIAKQLWSGFGAFSFVNDRSAHYDPGIPLLDLVSTVLFFAGLVVLLIGWRRPHSMLIVSWLAGTALFGGALIVNSPESPRYVTAAPAMLLVAAVGLVQGLEFVRARFGRPRFLLGPAAAVVVVVGLWNLNFYFRDYTPRNSHGWLNTEVTTEMGRFLAGRSSGDHVLFLGPPRIYLNNPTTIFLAKRVSGADVREPLVNEIDLPGLPAGRQPLFILLPERREEPSIIRRSYPDGKERSIMGTSGEPLFFVYEPARSN